MKCSPINKGKERERERKVSRFKSSTDKWEEERGVRERERREKPSGGSSVGRAVGCDKD